MSKSKCKDGKDKDANFKGSNGRKPYNGSRRNKSNPKSNEQLKDKMSVKSDGDINNPAYYYADANVLSQVMNFSFNEYGAVPVELDADGTGTTYSFNNPMIAAYHLNPCIPESVSGNAYSMDGVTTASLRNFLMLSGSNAKTTAYSPNDVTILMLALGECIKVSTFCARALGIAYLFNYRNRTYPEALLNAMCIDDADFNLNLATYRVRFNKLLALLSKIPFPSSIPLFRKAADLYGSMYLDDENSALAQTYLFVPNTVWLYDETYDANGSGLKTTPFAVAGINQSFNTYLNIFESMISALLNSTSLNYIYSDVMRLVQAGKLTNLLQFASIPETFTVVPVYNKEVETWLHNAVLLGDPQPANNIQTHVGSFPFTPDNDVSCDANTNKVLYHPQFHPTDLGGYSALLDFDHDQVTVEERVHATRLSARWTSFNNGSSWYSDDFALMDEYIVSVQFYDGTTSTPFGNLGRSFRDINADTGANIAFNCFIFSKFDWMPIVYYFNSNGNGLRLQGDLDYYTLVDYKTIKKMYDYEIIHFLQIE